MNANLAPHPSPDRRHRRRGLDSRHQRPISGRRPTARTATVAGLLALMVVASSCGGDASTAATPAAGGPTTTVPSTVVDEVAGSVDFATRTASVRVGDRSVQFCEGEGPFLCVSEQGRHVGSIEYAQWPVESLDVVGAVLDEGGSTEDALRAHARDFLATFEQDRPGGCGPDYRVLPDEIEEVVVGGVDGLRFGFRGVRDDRTLEHVIVHAALVEDEMFIITSSAYADDGCLERLGEFVPADLEAFAPALDSIVAGSRLPERAEDPSGPEEMPARILEVTEDPASIQIDRIEVLSGDQARQAAVQAGFLAPGEDLPNDFFVDEGDDTIERLGVDSGATVDVFDCDNECTLVQVPLADFLSGEVGAFFGDQVPWLLTVVDGRVTAMAEVYLP